MYDLVIRKNFKLSVAVIVLGCLLVFWHVAHDYREVQTVYSAYSPYVLLTPLMLLLLTTILWFAYYRDEDGHWSAFYMGWVLLSLAGGMLASAAFNEMSYSRSELLFLLYAGFSHVLYGLLDWREIFKMLGSDTTR